MSCHAAYSCDQDLDDLAQLLFCVEGEYVTGIFVYVSDV